LCFSDDVFYGLEFDFFFVFFIALRQISGSLGLLWSLLGFGFGLGDSSDDKPRFWADFKPLSSRET
jgi:hypothetical protein